METQVFKARQYLATHLKYPLFIELVTSPEKVTLRTYHELDIETVAAAVHVLPTDEEKDAPRKTKSELLALLPESLFQRSPVGTHAAMVGGELWPAYAADPMAPQVLVRGEDLSPSLHGRLFTELGTSCLDLSDPRLSPDMRTDAGEWLFDIRVSGHPVSPYNKNFFTQSKRMLGTRFALMFERTPVLRLFQPFKDTPLDQSSMYLTTHPEFGFKSSGSKLDWIPQPGRHADLSQLVPQLRWAPGTPSQIAADKATTLVIECFDPVTGTRLNIDKGDVSLEADSGYIPVRRLPLVGGRAEIPFVAMHLPVGHKVRLTAGFHLGPHKLSGELLVVRDSPTASILG